MASQGSRMWRPTPREQGADGHCKPAEGMATSLRVNSTCCSLLMSLLSAGRGPCSLVVASPEAWPSCTQHPDGAGIHPGPRLVVWREAGLVLACCMAH